MSVLDRGQQELDHAEQRRRDEQSTMFASYAGAFNSPSGKAMVDDLRAFCFADESTFSTNEREMTLKEGRRQVWLRIQLILKKAAT